MNVMAQMKSRLRADSGQSLVEFAITALVFLTLIFSILEFSFLFFARLSLQNAVREGGRYAITGQALPGLARYASILQVVEDKSMGFATSSNTQICSAAGGCSSGGGPGDTLTITVTYSYNFINPLVAAFFKNGVCTFTTSSSFKNEPFPPSQT